MSSWSRDYIRHMHQALTLLFCSWDATEDYATHENYNHEVDVGRKTLLFVRKVPGFVEITYVVCLFFTKKLLAGI